MRKLTIIPIIHTAREAAIDADQSIIARMRFQRAENFWSFTTSYIQNSNFNFDELRVYQDSLPFIEGVPERINIINVHEILNTTMADSPNFDLLRWLRDKGAKITGTDNTNIMKQLGEAFSSEDVQRIIQITAERDKSIGARISSTLKEDEQGLLFIGFMHSLEGQLQADIQTEVPKEVRDYYDEINHDFGRWRRI